MFSTAPEEAGVTNTHAKQQQQQQQPSPAATVDSDRTAGGGGGEGGSDDYENPLSPSDGNASINAGIITTVAEFAHPGQYLFFALVSRSWKGAWDRSNRAKVTTYLPHPSCSGGGCTRKECHGPPPIELITFLSVVWKLSC
ncbi:unnamed protein product, partial [Ectocarpus sp. 13 AM-2016]